jgi:hypothetical protein
MVVGAAAASEGPIVIPLMAERTFQPGFRLSALDVVILIVGGIASAYSMSIDRWLGIAIAFVVLHFFLFCNVLRMSRPLELIWAAIFAALAVATISWNLLSWPIVLAISSAVTIIVALIEMRRPSYHGVGWQQLNPRLPEWWQSATAAGGSHALQRTGRAERSL